MRNKKNKSNNFVIIGTIYLVILLTISVAYSFFNTDLSINATTGILNNNYDSDYILTEKQTSNNELCSYSYTINFNYSGNATTTGWKYYIKIPYDTEITECSNAASCYVEGEVLTISNDIDNGNLSPTNQSVSFSFQMKTNSKDYVLETLGIHFIANTSNNINSNTTISDYSLNNNHQPKLVNITSTSNITDS